jgi:tRNA pseudouridine38-40 synthase
MRRFLVNVQFFGKQYAGFQINGDQKTIEKDIEEALKQLFNQDITIIGASRTDSGVSARVFYFTFDVDTKLPYDRVAYKLNRFLPNEIQCQDSKEVDLNYNIRKEIESKTYEYSIYTGEHIMPILNRNAVYIKGDLDLEKMRDCSKALLGNHNFKSFCNYNEDVTSYDRNLFDIKIVRDNDYDNLIKFYLTADGFLYNMVRVIVGTLIECGQNRLSKDDLVKLLNEEDRSKNIAKTMQPKGLILYSVKFRK